MKSINLLLVTTAWNLKKRLNAVFIVLFRSLMKLIRRGSIYKLEILPLVMGMDEKA